MKKFEANNKYNGVKFGDVITVYERRGRRLFYRDNEGRHGVSSIFTDKDGNEMAHIFNNMDIINA